MDILIWGEDLICGGILCQLNMWLGGVEMEGVKWSKD